MNSKKNKFVPAFSLAEALITLLVVCLITLASIPVLTKKKRTTSASEHGRWMCTLNSQGKHVVWSTNSSGSIDNPDSWDLADSDSCTFVPPINARNFAISLSGGGGGGAGVQVSEGGSTTWNSSFAVNVPGYYDFLAVGAGGTGGGTTDVDGKSNSGGQGAAIAMRVFLDDSVDRVELTKGTVRTGENGGNNNGFPGNASTVKVFGKDKSTGQSYEDLLINAGGGAGGKGGTRGADDVKEERTASNPGQGNVSHTNRFTFTYLCHGIGSLYTNCTNNPEMFGGFSSDFIHASDQYCSTGYLTKPYQQNLNKFFTDKNNTTMAIFPEIECDKHNPAFNKDAIYLSDSQKDARQKFCAMPGIGGGARESRSPCTTGGESNKGGRTGTHGIVMASTKYFRTGDGGEAGESAKNLFYPKFETKKIKVYIGAGGKGSESGAGEDGGSTRIEGDNIAIMPVSGGKGGKMKADSESAMQTTAGGNGEKSGLFFDVEPELPLGGLNYEDPEDQTGAYNSSENGIKSNIGYGSGGGAGAIKFDPNTGQYTKGKGADGAPGAVIIEW